MRQKGSKYFARRKMEERELRLERKICKDERRTGGQEDRRTGGQEDRRTGRQEDRRTGGQDFSPCAQEWTPVELISRPSAPGRPVRPGRHPAQH